MHIFFWGYERIRVPYAIEKRKEEEAVVHQVVNWYQWLFARMTFLYLWRISLPLCLSFLSSLRFPLLAASLLYWRLYLLMFLDHCDSIEIVLFPSHRVIILLADQPIKQRSGDFLCETDISVRSRSIFLLEFVRECISSAGNYHHGVACRHTRMSTMGSVFSSIRDSLTRHLMQCPALKNAGKMCRDGTFKYRLSLSIF